ncbi:alpha/beta hydrolase [Aquincola sp. J276]|uniref:alpha/beta hydrolase n=1 Tax=Aquincola sp. J276 TaxID=2898432 RepID=UPI00215087F9|nr:lysophospholipase [Aquincola sp. J276]MCR5866102.1 alpha/beta hydrolase [Aquincola sp. J276]
MRRLAWKALAALLVVALAAYALMLGALWWKQETLIFHPVPLAADHRFDLPADAQEVFIDVPGARLNALHLRRPGARGVVFFLHGNAGNLERWFVNLDFYRALGMDLFMLDYRGYGKSTGRIESEQQLLADVQAAWARVAPQYAGRHVVFLGRSLGTGLAARLAADLPPAQRPQALLLVSPYRSMVQMAAEQYPFVPAPLLRYPLRTDAALRALAGTALPIDLVHGDRDTLIPLAHSEALARTLPGVRLHRVAGAGHGDLQRFEAYEAALRDAMAPPRGR